jgi:hypothetical protein
MPKTDSCNGCGQTFAIANLRYVRAVDGWVYLCSTCRKALKAEAGKP